MKYFNSLLVILAFAFAGISQNALYVKYETTIDASGEEGEMMAMMMSGSTMEVATDSKRTYVKTQIGTMMTMVMDFDIKKDFMTMFMSGMMGDMAFEGSPSELEEDGIEEVEPEIEFTGEKKKILGYKCNQAVTTSADGTKAVFWYTEKFDRPEGMKQMPNQLPGLCLEFEVIAQGSMTMKYTAIEFDEDADMDDYKVEIPEGVEIKGLEEMQNMGM